MSLSGQDEDLTRSKDLPPKVSDKTSKEKRTSFLSFLRELVVLIVVAYVLALLIRTFVAQPFKIEQQSMLPTLYPGDRIFTNKFIYRVSEPKRGDIITLEEPNADGRVLVKRIIATEGEAIAVKNGQVYINERAAREPYVVFNDTNANFGPVKIPKDYVFVMGDNRPQSRDSRFFGSLPERSLIGKAFLVYWPPARIKFISNRY